MSEVLEFHENVKNPEALLVSGKSTYINFFKNSSLQISFDNVAWNLLQIGPKGAEFIADMLGYNNTISILDLRANGLRDDVRSYR